MRAWPCKTLIAPNTTAEIVVFSPVRRTTYAEGCILPGKRPLHPLLYVPHPLMTTARLGSSSSSTQASAAAAAATLPPLPPPTMLLETIHVTGALAVATFALSALLAAADSTLNAIASSRSRRRYMFPTRLLAGRVRSASDLAKGARAGQCRLRHVRRTTHLNRTGVDHQRNGLRRTSSGGFTS